MGRAACRLHTTDSLIADSSSRAGFALALTAYQMPPTASFIHTRTTRPHSHSLFRWALDGIRRSLCPGATPDTVLVHPSVTEANPFHGNVLGRVSVSSDAYPNQHRRKWINVYHSHHSVRSNPARPYRGVSGGDSHMQQSS